MKNLFVILSLFCCLVAGAAEVIPPAPKQYFNDYANVVSPGVASQLNGQLEEFERQTSSQIVVAIYPHMQSDSSIEDYSVRVYRAWDIGLKNKNNGALLLVYTEDHKMRIATGYGLEGALPDVICNRIMDDEIAPHLKQGDFNGGMSAGVAAMMAAAKGEYKGSGSTVAGRANQNHSSWVTFLVVFLIIIYVLSRLTAAGMGVWEQVGLSAGGGWGVVAEEVGVGAVAVGGGFSGGGGSTGGGGASGSW